MKSLNNTLLSSKHVIKEYLLTLKDESLKLFLDETNVRSIGVKTNCVIELTSRILNRKVNAFKFIKYAIIRIIGPDEYAIRQCNRLLEHQCPPYRHRKEYNRKSECCTIYSQEFVPDNAELCFPFQRTGITTYQFGDILIKSPYEPTVLRSNDNCQWRSGDPDLKKGITAIHYKQNDNFLNWYFKNTMLEQEPFNPKAPIKYNCDDEEDFPFTSNKDNYTKTLKPKKYVDYPEKRTEFISGSILNDQIYSEFETPMSLSMVNEIKNRNTDSEISFKETIKVDKNGKDNEQTDVKASKSWENTFLNESVLIKQLNETEEALIEKIYDKIFSEIHNEYFVNSTIPFGEKDNAHAKKLERKHISQDSFKISKIKNDKQIRKKLTNENIGTNDLSIMKINKEEMGIKVIEESDTDKIPNKESNYKMIAEEQNKILDNKINETPVNLSYEKSSSQLKDKMSNENLEVKETLKQKFSDKNINKKLSDNSKENIERIKNKTSEIREIKEIKDKIENKRSSDIFPERILSKKQSDHFTTQLNEIEYNRNPDNIETNILKENMKVDNNNILSDSSNINVDKLKDLNMKKESDTGIKPKLSGSKENEIVQIKKLNSFEAKMEKDNMKLKELNDQRKNIENIEEKQISDLNNGKLNREIIEEKFNVRNESENKIPKGLSSDKELSEKITLFHENSLLDNSKLNEFQQRKDDEVKMEDKQYDNKEIEEKNRGGLIYENIKEMDAVNEEELMNFAILNDNKESFEKENENANESIKMKPVYQPQETDDLYQYLQIEQNINEEIQNNKIDEIGNLDDIEIAKLSAIKEVSEEKELFIEQKGKDIVELKKQNGEVEIIEKKDDELDEERETVLSDCDQKKQELEKRMIQEMRENKEEEMKKLNEERENSLIRKRRSKDKKLSEDLDKKRNLKKDGAQEFNLVDSVENTSKGNITEFSITAPVTNPKEKVETGTLSDGSFKTESKDNQKPKIIGNDENISFGKTLDSNTGQFLIEKCLDGITNSFIYAHTSPEDLLGLASCFFLDGLIENIIDDLLLELTDIYAMNINNYQSSQIASGLHNKFDKDILNQVIEFDLDNKSTDIELSLLKRNSSSIRGDKPISSLKKNSIRTDKDPRKISIKESECKSLKDKINAGKETSKKKHSETEIFKKIDSKLQEPTINKKSSGNEKIKKIIYNSSGLNRENLENITSPSTTFDSTKPGHLQKNMNKFTYTKQGTTVSGTKISNDYFDRSFNDSQNSLSIISSVISDGYSAMNNYLFWNKNKTNTTQEIKQLSNNDMKPNGRNSKIINVETETFYDKLKTCSSNLDSFLQMNNDRSYLQKNDNYDDLQPSILTSSEEQIGCCVSCRERNSQKKSLQSNLLKNQRKTTKIIEIDTIETENDFLKSKLLKSTIKDKLKQSNKPHLELTNSYNLKYQIAEKLNTKYLFSKLFHSIESETDILKMEIINVNLKLPLEIQLKGYPIRKMNQFLASNQSILILTYDIKTLKHLFPQIDNCVNLYEIYGERNVLRPQNNKELIKYSEVISTPNSNFGSINVICTEFKSKQKSRSSFSTTISLENELDPTDILENFVKYDYDKKSHLPMMENVDSYRSYSVQSFDNSVIDNENIAIIMNDSICSQDKLIDFSDFSVNSIRQSDSQTPESIFLTSEYTSENRNSDMRYENSFTDNRFNFCQNDNHFSSDFKSSEVETYMTTKSPNYPIIKKCLLFPSKENKFNKKVMKENGLVKKFGPLKNLINSSIDYFSNSNITENEQNDFSNLSEIFEYSSITKSFSVKSKKSMKSNSKSRQRTLSEKLKSKALQLISKWKPLKNCNKVEKSTDTDDNFTTVTSVNFLNYPDQDENLNRINIDSDLSKNSFTQYFNAYKFDSINRMKLKHNSFKFKTS